MKWPSQCLNCGFLGEIRHAFRRYYWKEQWRDILEHLGLKDPRWKKKSSTPKSSHAKRRTTQHMKKDMTLAEFWEMRHG